MNTETGFISLHQWRRILNIGRDKAYAAVRSGDVKGFKGGKGAWYVSISEIRDYPIRQIEAREVPS